LDSLRCTFAIEAATQDQDKRPEPKAKDHRETLQTEKRTNP
jgi:hypothetical protein